MVVPYGDPQAQQVRKNAFDVSDYGIGAMANSLRLGCDCLGDIHYFHADLVTSRGEPWQIPNAVCMHEEDFGIIWKHTDRHRGDDGVDVRRSRRLVISSFATAENYDYGFFWYLYQDGNIQFECKMTGILSVAAAHPGETPKYGTMIAPQLYAPAHQHIFNMRMDFAVDGPNNTVVRVDIQPETESDQNPFKNAFYAQKTILKTEQQAMANLSLDTSRSWDIINPNVRNCMGQPVGYKLAASDNTIPFATKTAYWRQRAGFVNHHVWVTPFAEREMFAAGEYPNQHPGGDGLPAWTAKDRPIENRDCVLWYTFGNTHVPRPEDYPVMPVVYLGFMLKPVGFFDRNPANDVPPQTLVNGVSGFDKSKL